MIPPRLWASLEELVAHLEKHPEEMGFVHSVIEPFRDYPPLYLPSMSIGSITLADVRRDLIDLIAQHGGGHRLVNCPMCESERVHMQNRTQLNNDEWVNQWICMDCHWSKEFYDNGEIHEERHKYD